jgi:hypothetical protein
VSRVSQTSIFSRRFSWWIGAWRSIRCAGIHPIRRGARIHRTRRPPRDHRGTRGPSCLNRLTSGAFFREDWGLQVPPYPKSSRKPKYSRIWAPGGRRTAVSGIVASTTSPRPRRTCACHCTRERTSGTPVPPLRLTGQRWKRPLRLTGQRWKRPLRRTGQHKKRWLAWTRPGASGHPGAAGHKENRRHEHN